jgi:P-type E1-E2 ATPase
VIETLPAEGFTVNDVLSMAASLETYSRHPLAEAVLNAAKSANIVLHEASRISEPPGAGLEGIVMGRTVRITNRSKAIRASADIAGQLPPQAGGMEAVVLVDGRLAGLIRFRDEPRSEGRLFIRHLAPRHGFHKVMLVSGDRESEVTWLAEKVGIRDVYFSQSPEQKLEITRNEVEAAPTVFVGDGINDAPALMAATVGVAFGQNSDVTSEAAGVVILDSSLERFDEFLTISHRMRRVALQSALGGMAASLVGMFVAAAGFLPPVAGALTQEVIDVVAVLNALRAAFPPKMLADFRERV